MNAALWFVAGVFVGFDIGLAYAWLTFRRANRRRADSGVAGRIKPYVGQRSWPW